MSNFAVVVDSVADLPREIVQQYDFVEVPFPVNFGNQSFRDKVDLKAKQFFHMLRSKLDYPKTSGPPVGEYLEAFQGLIQKGKSVLSLTISAKNSNAYQSAILARSLLEEGEVEVVDTGTISMGLGLVAIESAHACREESTKERILERIGEIIANVQILAIVPDLTWAARGGRVPVAVARLASLLNIRPIIRIRHGVIDLVSRASGYQASLDKLVQRVRASVGNLATRISVIHADIPEGAIQLCAQLRREINVDGDILISEVGPALGSHSGPDALAVAFYPLAGFVRR